MDPVSKFLVEYKIPVGAWGKAFFEFLTDNFNTFFRGFSNGLNFLLDVDGRHPADDAAGSAVPWSSRHRLPSAALETPGSRRLLSA